MCTCRHQKPHEPSMSEAEPGPAPTGRCLRKWPERRPCVHLGAPEGTGQSSSDRRPAGTVCWRRRSTDAGPGKQPWFSPRHGRACEERKRLTEPVQPRPRTHSSTSLKRDNYARTFLSPSAIDSVNVCYVGPETILLPGWPRAARRVGTTVVNIWGDTQATAGRPAPPGLTSCPLAGLPASLSRGAGKTVTTWWVLCPGDAPDFSPSFPHGTRALGSASDQHLPLRVPLPPPSQELRFDA